MSSLDSREKLTDLEGKGRGKGKDKRAKGHEGKRAKGHKGKRAKTTNYNFPHIWIMCEKFFALQEIL